MIGTITGTVSEIGVRCAIVDVGGIGYKVFVTDDTIHLLKLSKTAMFWTYLAVRENALDLYGFLSKKEKDFFELLIGVSGIGPKSALNILSLVSAEALASSIQTGSVAHLVKVSGIGKKTAEKIVLELKDKLGGFGSDENGFTAAGMSSDMDAILALQALGYEADDAREALKKVSRDISDIGDKVKAALKVLA
jgi:Holliday junction DNA helicase RuvA